VQHEPEKRAAVSEYNTRRRVLAAEWVASEQRAMSDGQRASVGFSAVRRGGATGTGMGRREYPMGMAEIWAIVERKRQILTEALENRLGWDRNTDIPV
jgi:hypothetical protein